MLNRLETVTLAKRQEVEMELAELKMLRVSLAVTRMYTIRNEYIRGTAQVGRCGGNPRGKTDVDMYERKTMGTLEKGVEDGTAMKNETG